MPRILQEMEQTELVVESQDWAEAGKRRIDEFSGSGFSILPLIRSARAPVSDMQLRSHTSKWYRPRSASGSWNRRSGVQGELSACTACNFSSCLSLRGELDLKRLDCFVWGV